MTKVTMQTIADKCGVSKGLVSIALSDKYGVNEKTRSEIVVCAIQLGYDFAKVKNYKGFKNKKVIYVLTKDIDLHVDRFWPQIIKGIDEEASLCGYKIKVKIWNDDTDYEKFTAEIIDFKCSGIIIISEISPFVFSNLVLCKTPMVLVDGKMMYDDRIDIVSVNNYMAFYSITKYVIEKGHRHLAFVGDSEYAYSYRQRLNGFRDCVACYDDVYATTVTHKGDDPELTYCYNKQVLTRVLKEGKVDVYLCASDNISEKVYELAKEFNIRIPQDISVVGFDDNFISKKLIPSLTTVRVPKSELGKSSVDMLLERIKNTDSIFKRLNLNGELVIRDSVIDRNNN